MANLSKVKPSLSTSHAQSSATAQWVSDASVQLAAANSVHVVKAAAAGVEIAASVVNHAVTVADSIAINF